MRIHGASCYSRGMEILLFRHGPAGDKEAWKKAGKDDAERPLTADGEDKTAKAAAGLKELVDGLDLVVESPLLRSHQSAEALARRFKKAQRAVWEELAPGAEPARVLETLATLSKLERVALVGHEPHLSRLAGLLIGAPGAKLELKKAGACLLDAPRPAPGAARLLWLLQPSQLRALR